MKEYEQQAEAYIQAEVLKRDQQRREDMEFEFNKRLAV